MNEMNSTRISVIVPVYKVEKYLNECVTSITNQTYQNMEIILVDDGSPDNCPEMCDSWAQKDNRITVIHKTNGGLSSARNAGIDIATGKYLSFVDSDDTIEKDMLKTMFLAAQKYNAEIVCCGRKLIVSENDIRPMHCILGEKIYTSEEAMSEVLLGRDIEEAAWDKLYRAELFQNIRYPVGEINEDIPIIGPLLSQCHIIVHVGKAFYNYRLNPNSITKSCYTEKKSVYLKHMQQVQQYVSEHFPRLNNETEFFLARYAYAALLEMEMNEQTVQNYKKDYKNYKKILSQNYHTYCKSEMLSLKTRVQSQLILWGLYGPILRAKKRIVKK